MWSPWRGRSEGTWASYGCSFAVLASGCPTTSYANKGIPLSRCLFPKSNYWKNNRMLKWSGFMNFSLRIATTTRSLVSCSAFMRWQKLVQKCPGQCNDISINAFRLAGPQIYRSVEERSVGRKKMSQGWFGWLALEDSNTLYIYIYMYVYYILYIYFSHVAGQLLYSNNRVSYRKATVAINSLTNVPNDWNTADLVAGWHVMTVNFTECRIQALKFKPPQHVTYRVVWWNVMQIIWNMNSCGGTSISIRCLPLLLPRRTPQLHPANCWLPPGATGSIWEGRRRACEVEGWEVEDPSCLVAKLWRISWPTIPNPHHLQEMNETETFKQKIRCNSEMRWVVCLQSPLGCGC